MSPPEVIVHHDAGLLAKAAAARLVTKLVDVQAAAGRASLVLTGGGIGTAVLTELAAAPARDAVDWRHLDIWWGDERFLPSGNTERNEAGTARHPTRYPGDASRPRHGPERRPARSARRCRSRRR